MSIKVQKTIRREFQETDPYRDREGIVYARVSTKRQESEGTGLSSQEGRCIAELKILGVPHKKTFPDSYTGGGDFMNRPAMRELIEYIDQNPHKKFIVVFDDLKRFARDIEFHFKLKTVFHVRDVKLKCLNYTFDETPEGRFSEIIMAGQAELERYQNQRQVIQKQKSRLELGYWAFGSKKGYEMISNTQHGNIAMPYEPEAAILKKVLEDFSMGTILRKVDACKVLVDAGFWKNQKPERYIDYFTKILKDPFYAGYIEYPKWDVTRRLGYHQGIISEETFQLNQKRLGMGEITKRIRKDMSDDFPYRGLIVCRDCNKHLTSAWSKGRKNKYAYYFCQNSHCSAYRVSIKALDIETKFDILLKQQNLKSEVGGLVETIFERVWNSEVDLLKKQEVIQQREREQLTQKVAKLTDMASSTKLDKVRSIYESQIEETVTKIEALESDIGVSEIDLSIPYRTALDKSIGFLKNPYVVWTKLPTNEKQGLFHFIFTEKLAYSKKDGYRTANLPSATSLFEEFVTTKSEDVEMGGLNPRAKRVLKHCYKE